LSHVIGSSRELKIKNDGARAVGRKGCSTNNISPHDDGDFKGWRLKARCSGGDTIYVFVDLNGDIASVDVQLFDTSGRSKKFELRISDCEVLSASYSWLSALWLRQLKI